MLHLHPHKKGTPPVYTTCSTSLNPPFPLHFLQKKGRVGEFFATFKKKEY